MTDKLYPEHDPYTLEPRYSQHVAAMTSEDLHSKHDIAIQLAARDKRISELEKLCKSTAYTCPEGTKPELLPFENRIIRAGELAAVHAAPQILFGLRRLMIPPLAGRVSICDVRAGNLSLFAGCGKVDARLFWEEEREEKPIAFMNSVAPGHRVTLLVENHEVYDIDFSATFLGLGITRRPYTAPRVSGPYEDLPFDDGD